MADMYGYNSSTARKLDYYKSESGHNTHNELQKERQHKKNTVKRRQKASLGFRRIISAAAVFAMAFAIVNGYVRINEAESNVLRLKKEYDDTIATNQSLQVKIDRAIDLEQLQTIAGEKYGMVRPERHQTFYVDMAMDDNAENFAEMKESEKKNKVAVMGVSGTITGTFNIFR